MATPLDIFTIDMPREMRSYLRSYGFNFNKKACDIAVKAMRRLNPATGKKEPIDPLSKEQVEELLQKHNIKLEHNEGLLTKVLRWIYILREHSAMLSPAFTYSSNTFV